MRDGGRVAQRLKRSNHKPCEHRPHDGRPWGFVETRALGAYVQIKRPSVHPGQQTRDDCPVSRHQQHYGRQDHNAAIRRAYPGPAASPARVFQSVIPVSFAIPARRKSLRAMRVLLPLAALLPAAAQGPVAAGPASAYQSTMTLAQAAPAPPPAPNANVDPECLTIAQSSATTYVISNTACANESVLTSIELVSNDAIARCFTKKIRSQISIASEHAAPIINYQCIEGRLGCTAEILREMFPECRAG